MNAIWLPARRARASERNGRGCSNHQAVAPVRAGLRAGTMKRPLQAALFDMANVEPGYAAIVEGLEEFLDEGERLADGLSSMFVSGAHHA